MQIEWWTLALQALNFLVLIWLLQHFLYKPVREVIEKRKKLAEQAFADAAEKSEEAEAAKKEYEDSRRKLAAERQDLLKKLHAEAEGERAKTIEGARREAEEMLESARTTIAEERRAALVGLREEIADLAAKMAARLLSTTGPQALNDSFLGHVERQLADLPEDERNRLRDDLSDGGGVLKVVTPVPLSPAEQARWRERLGTSLEQTPKTDFIVDPEIIGGTELRFPHAVLKFTWADQLEKAKDALCHDETAAR